LLIDFANDESKIASESFPVGRGQEMARTRKTISKEVAARKLTALAMEHLSQYTPAERDARIKAFGRTVAKLAAKRAKYSKDSSALEGRRRIRAHG